MDPGKLIDCDTASGENDPDQSEKNDDGVGRSYECTFCKRGFTNAQALGGHMNIHRKDKAKAAKQKNQEEPSTKNTKPSDDNTSSWYNTFGQVLSVDQQHQGVQQLLNYQVFLPSLNLSFHSKNNWSRVPFWRLENCKEVSRKDENLSLRIGLPPPAQEGRKENEEKNDQVDLELRLGHDP